MPLADLTAIANLALDHLGEPYLDDYATDTGTTAEAVRLHLPQCMETVLEGHVWSFATRCAQLAPVGLTITTATLTTGTGNASILWTADTQGPIGNEVEITIAAGNRTNPLVTTAATSVQITIPLIPLTLTNSATLTAGGNPLPLEAMDYNGITNEKPAYQAILGEEWGCDVFWDGTQWIINPSVGDAAWISDEDVLTPDLVETWTPDGTVTGTPVFSAPLDNTALAVIAAVTAHPAASLLVTASLPSGSDGSGAVTATTAHLTGGSSTSEVYAPAYAAAYRLPENCLRLLKIDGDDISAPVRRFEIQGRYLLLETTDVPVVHYIADDPPVPEWPTTYTDAVAYLLAARLAPKLTQNHALATDLSGRHELALGKARSKDARETRSGENWGPRQLAARSGLVASRRGDMRFANSPLPDAPANP